ncbi:MAG: hypothetical protein ACK5DM_21070 [Planctomyces sp.]
MRILLSVVSLCAFCCTADASVINFTGPFDVANWTQAVTNGGDGSFDLTNAPLNVTLFGSDNGFAPIASDTRFSITPTTGWFIGFDWQYSTADFSPFWDPAGYSINGVFTQLSNDAGSQSQSGQVRNLLIVPGDVFAFEQRSPDSSFGRAQMTISSFSATVSSFSATVPEPASFIPVAVAFAAFGVRAFRRRRATQTR